MACGRYFAVVFTFRGQEMMHSPATVLMKGEKEKMNDLDYGYSDRTQRNFYHGL